MAILVDISGVLHKAVHYATKDIPARSDTIQLSEYKRPLIDYIINELIQTELQYKQKYGDLIICFDYKGKDSYWRKDIYPDYKGNRKAAREKSKFDYNDVFKAFDEVKEILDNYSPWKCVTAERAEADDIMLVLSRELGQNEKILIYSADKDLIQAQHNNPNVSQYSHQTKQWIEPEDKHDNMEHWFLEHQCLGDASDNIFHILHKSEFSDNFINHLKDNNIHEDFHDVKTFKESNIENKKDIIKSFNKYKKPKKNEITPILDVYKDIRFGPTTLDKKIKEHGSLSNFLESNGIIKENYERNFILVMEEGIPEYVWNNIINSYVDSKTDFNKDKLYEFFDENGLHQCKMDFQRIYTGFEQISAKDLDW